MQYLFDPRVSVNSVSSQWYLKSVLDFSSAVRTRQSCSLHSRFRYLNDLSVLVKPVGHGSTITALVVGSNPYHACHWAQAKLIWKWGQNWNVGYKSILSRKVVNDLTIKNPNFNYEFPFFAKIILEIVFKNRLRENQSAKVSKKLIVKYLPNDHLGVNSVFPTLYSPGSNWEFKFKASCFPDGPKLQNNLFHQNRSKILELFLRGR